MKIQAIDLFCGIGGLTYGLQEADIEVLAGLDNDAFCKDTYIANNRCTFITADISTYDFMEMKNMYAHDSVRVLVGCAPCQPFSSHTFKAKKKENDTRWSLIKYFLEAIKTLEPHVISMENVRGIMNEDIFKDFVKNCREMGYNLDYKVVYCPDYGIPQRRSRIVLLGSTLGEIKIPQKTHSKETYKTVKDFIGELPRIEAGETSCEDPIHKAKNLSPLNKTRIRQSKPKGTWKDWDENLLPNCYRKPSGQTYTSVYGRMSWEDVAPTLTTQFFNYGSGRFGHPKQDRALSLREGALLQTFPKAYYFNNKISSGHIAKHIGNAVPPKLGFVIGKTVTEHIKLQNCS